MTYSIGEVEDLTGIKAHVLRYWEEVIPGPVWAEKILWC